MRPSEHRLGVLFEISIVCHVFVFVVLVGGWGFVFWLVRRVFSGSGFFWFLGLLAFLRFCRGGWGAGCWGFSRVRGWVRPVLLLLLVGVGVGCAWRVRLLRFCAGVGCVRAWFLTSLVWGWGWVRVRLVHSWDAVSGGGSDGPAPVFCAGVGCAWFPVSCSRCFWSCSRRGFRVFLFPLGASFLWFGGCRVGLGLFFLRLFCPVRACFGFGCWFCLESLILAQDERWRRA